METTQAVIEQLQKLELGSVGQRVKFEVKDVGCFVIKGKDVFQSNEDRDCIVTASLDTYRGLLHGRLSPTALYLTGKLKVKGNISVAMQLKKILANITRS